MAKKSNHLPDLEADDAGGVLNGLLAEENELDRRALWRLASWGVGATGAVVLAVMANQSSLGVRRDQIAAADLTRQAQQIQTVAKDTHNEARRLAAAIETLNMDRDRLYSRVTSLEQGLDSVTGAIAKQGSGASSPPVPRAEPQTAPSAPPVAPVATAPAAPAAPVADKSTSGAPTGEPNPATVAAAAKEAVKSETAKAENAEPEAAAKGDLAKPKAAKPSPATPLMASRSMMAPPDPAAGRLVEPSKALGAVIASPIPDVVASTSSEPDTDDAAPKVSLQRTEFGVDLGTANSVNGLRALWRGLLKSRSNAPLASLRPIIVIKEGTNGLGMQLRLVAGPINDAGAAAKICAVLTENNRHCDTTVFDGQRLSVQSDDPPAAAKPTQRRRSLTKRATTAVVVEEAQTKPDAPPAAPQSTLSSIFSRKNQQ
ncbi:hypothetical protein [Bradyrhizobium sp.]|uniref:hypothetical protein n=1 Tax=Bradyrhizobium sp. TaxID=376 RepID=UPI002B58DCFA|nr:hypothetical protein [Bradyrhizobium sp.]HMM88717.1 hypothetical protein [Bradyrhizobium sp.]